ncbi:hypothetical protein FOZ63_010791, partial [Perkinsus olseni]
MAGAAALRRSSRLQTAVDEAATSKGTKRRQSGGLVTTTADGASKDVDRTTEIRTKKTPIMSIRVRCRRSSRLSMRRDSVVDSAGFSTPPRLLGQMQSPQELSQWWTSDYDACPPYFAHENHPLYDMRYSPPSQDDRHWRRIIRKSTKMRDACMTGRRRTSVASRRSSISSTFTDVPPPVEESGNFNPVSLAELQQVCEELGKPTVAVVNPPTRRQASVSSRHGTTRRSARLHPPTPRKSTRRRSTRQ